MKRLFALISGVVLVLGGCSFVEQAPAPIPGAVADCGDSVKGPNSEHALSIGDTTWTYLVHTPPGYGDQELPVIYLMHGLGGNANDFQAYTLMTVAADQHGFIVVTPQSPHEDLGWNVKDGPDVKGSDMDFMAQLMDRVDQEWCVDAAQQFVAGFSNGSFLAFAMACDASYPVAGYAGVAGASYSEKACAAAPPTTMIYFHGNADPIVPFDGGDTPTGPVAPAPSTMVAWAKHNKCTNAVTRDVAADVRVQEWIGCQKARMAFYTITEGGHTWPGATVEYPGTGSTTPSIKATDRIVDFFGLD